MKRLPLILIFTLLIAILLSLVSGASDVGEYTGTLILVGVIAFIVTILIFVIAVVASYKKKLRGAIYPLDKFTTLDLTSHSDTYSHSHTTRYKYKSSDNKK